MPDPAILASTLTYAATLAVAFLLLLGQFAAFTVLLAVAGAIRLLTIPARALSGRGSSAAPRGTRQPDRGGGPTM